MTKQEKLEKFKRNNKVRREILAKREGFNTALEYIEWLSGVKRARKKAKIETTDMVIAFDTTGSMFTYLNDVKKHIKELIPNLFKDIPNLQLKIVAFGDYCDMISPLQFGKAYQECELTTDQNALIDFVNKAKDTSGGDQDEFYELVIRKITNETEWRNGKKVVLLIADYNPHPIGYQHGNIYGFDNRNKIEWIQEAKKAAELGIQFDTLTIVPSVTWYKELSRITSGISLPFKSANKMSQVVEAVAYSRGSTASFTSSMCKVMAGSDEELKGVYKSLSTKLD